MIRAAAAAVVALVSNSSLSRALMYLYTPNPSATLCGRRCFLSLLDFGDDILMGLYHTAKCKIRFSQIFYTIFIYLFIYLVCKSYSRNNETAVIQKHKNIEHTPAQSVNIIIKNYLGVYLRSNQHRRMCLFWGNRALCCLHILFSHVTRFHWQRINNTPRAVLTLLRWRI